MRRTRAEVASRAKGHTFQEASPSSQPPRGSLHGMGPRATVEKVIEVVMLLGVGGSEGWSGEWLAHAAVASHTREKT